MTTALADSTTQQTVPFVLGLFTESTGRENKPTGRFDPALQISVTSDGNPSCAGEFSHSQTLGGVSGAGEVEMMYVDTPVPPSREALTVGPRPLALGLMANSHPAPGGRSAESPSSTFEPAWW